MLSQRSFVRAMLPATVHSRRIAAAAAQSGRMRASQMVKQRLQNVIRSLLGGPATSRQCDMRRCNYACFLASILAAALLGATTSHAQEGPQHEIHDSAGISIVQNRAPAPGSRLGWAIGDEPVVSIGTRDASDAFQFYRIGDATRLADGRIVVANGSSNELLVFDADGNHLDAWAGQGDGPGEFWDLSTVHPWPGDSLIAGDSQQGRASVFDLAGTPGRTMSLRNPADPTRRKVAATGRAADVRIPLPLCTMSYIACCATALCSHGPPGATPRDSTGGNPRMR